MITEELRLEGRRLFEERLKHGSKYVIYRSQHDARTHASMDGHTHLAKYCNSSPRLFFTSTKGSSGKSRAILTSWFYVQYPISVTASGPSLIWDIKEGIDKGFLPTVIYDEAQDAWKPPGNEMVQALFNSYIKGFPRIVWSGQGPIKLDMFCSVIMNGLTTKYDIPSNFLERCIQIPLLKRLNHEAVEDFEYSDLVEEIGNELRIPRIEWSNNFNRDDIKSFRPKVSEMLKSKGIVNRDAELWKPLCEYAYLCGDDTFEALLAAAEHLLGKNEENKKYTIKEQLLVDLYEIFSKPNSNDFIASSDIIEELNEMDDRPWSSYKGNNPLNAHNLAFLLRDYEGIKPTKEEKTQARGYTRGMFINIWERDLNLDINSTLAL